MWSEVDKRSPSTQRLMRSSNDKPQQRAIGLLGAFVAGAIIAAENVYSRKQHHGQEGDEANMIRHMPEQEIVSCIPNIYVHVLNRSYRT